MSLTTFSKVITVVTLFVSNLKTVEGQCPFKRARYYNNAYQEAEEFIGKTNCICNSIQNHTFDTNYFCNDSTLKTGLSNFPLPMGDCKSSIDVDRIYDYSEQIICLNKLICNEIINNNLTIISSDSINNCCLTSNSKLISISFLVGCMIILVNFLI